MLGFSLLWWVLLAFSIIRKERYFLFVCLLLTLSVLIGFRGLEVGPDTQTYALIFESVGENRIYTYPEPLWVLLNFIVYSLGGDFHILLWCASLITLWCISDVVKKYSPNILFSLFILYSLYFIFYSMNITRQIVAVSFVFYAYSKLIKNRLFLFIFYVLIATLFHYTAIVSCVVLFVTKIQITKKRLYWGIFLSFIGGFFFINDTLLGYILGPYAQYLSSSENGYRSSIFLPFILSVFYYACLYIIHLRQK